MAELQKLGVRSVPVLSRGDKYTFGQSTKQIVDFLGLKEKSGPELSTEELAGRAATARWPSICSVSSQPSSTPTRASPWTRRCSARSPRPTPIRRPW